MKPGRLASIALAVVLLPVVVPARAATIRIIMVNLDISPIDVLAKVGDTVEWINKDVFAHTATAKNGDFDVILPPKKSAMFVLKKSGTVDYYCRFHPNMKATLKIEP